MGQRQRGWGCMGRSRPGRQAYSERGRLQSVGPLSREAQPVAKRVGSPRPAARARPGVPALQHLRGGEGPLFLLRAAGSVTGLEDVRPSPGGGRPSGVRPQNGVCLGLPAEEGPQGFSRAGRESGLSWGSASMAGAKQGPKQRRSTSALWMGLIHPQAPGWWPQSCPGAASLPRVPREQGRSLVAMGPWASWDG